MMAFVTLVLDVRVACWLMPVLKGLLLFYEVTGREPDPEVLKRVLSWGVKTRIRRPLQR
jgi:hypothetical protein